MLSSGAAALVIHLDPGPMRVFAAECGQELVASSGAMFNGARQRPLILDTSLGATVGVHFRPGGARPFFDVPADALAEQSSSSARSTSWCSARRW